MTAKSLLLDGLKTAHQLLEATMEGVTDEVANKQPEGIANSIAATYAHVIASEDMFVNMVLLSQSPLFASDWLDKTGMSEPMPGPESDWGKDYPIWAKKVTIDVAKMHEYAKAVYQKSEAYLGELQESELDKEIDMSTMGMDKMTVGAILAGFVIAHARDGMGEISAIKGTQGLKGYPF